MEATPVKGKNHKLIREKDVESISGEIRRLRQGGELTLGERTHRDDFS